MSQSLLERIQAKPLRTVQQQIQHEIEYIDPTYAAEGQRYKELAEEVYARLRVEDEARRDAVRAEHVTMQTVDTDPPKKPRSRKRIGGKA